MTKTVLLLGGGGREHAMAWKLAQSPVLSHVYVLPGSDGIAELDKVTCIAGDASDAAFVASIAASLSPDLVIIGPEKPLAAGVADALVQDGFLVVGPIQAAARLESSKIFAKHFMRKNGIPTADFWVFDAYDDVERHIAEQDIERDGLVIKADGLAAGKGVVVTHDRAEALKVAYDFMCNPQSPIQSPQLLIEKKITGREVSAFALCDGKGFITLGFACDYKRVGDNDQGPNTGGMGGYAPKGWPSAAARTFIENYVFEPVVRGMQAQGTPFCGILFAGLMVDGDDVKVIEFNTRFGDPETQILLPLIEGDIYPVFESAARGCLDQAPSLSFKDQHSVHVVMTSGGYPETFGKKLELGKNITFPQGVAPGACANDCVVFIAGARKDGAAWINTGGRVLGVTALGRTAAEARENAYQAVNNIAFDGAHWRKDIASNA